MKVGEIIALLSLFCLLTGGSGCAVLVAGAAGAGAGVGTYSYIEGNLKRDYMGPLPKVWKAALEALEQLDIPSNVENKDAFGGLVEGIMHDGTKFTIQLKKISDQQTEVGVRVGFLGDRAKSELIQETITEKFKSQ